MKLILLCLIVIGCGAFLLATLPISPGFIILYLIYNKLEQNQ